MPAPIKNAARPAQAPRTPWLQCLGCCPGATLGDDELDESRFIHSRCTQAAGDAVVSKALGGDPYLLAIWEALEAPQAWMEEPKRSKPFSASECADLRRCLGREGGKCIEHDVVIKKGVSIHHDVCVHGSVTVLSGGVCVTGNVVITGDLRVEAGSSGICITGNVLVGGNAYVASPSCTTGGAAVKGALTVDQANTDVSQGLVVKGEAHFIAKPNPE